MCGSTLCARLAMIHISKYVVWRFKDHYGWSRRYKNYRCSIWREVTIDRKICLYSYVSTLSKGKQAHRCLFNQRFIMFSYSDPPCLQDTMQRIFLCMLLIKLIKTMLNCHLRALLFTLEYLKFMITRWNIWIELIDTEGLQNLINVALPSLLMYDDWYYPWNHGRTWVWTFFNNYIYIYIYWMSIHHWTAISMVWLLFLRNMV